MLSWQMRQSRCCRFLKSPELQPKQKRCGASDTCCYISEASPRCESSQSCFRKHCRSTNRPLLIMWSYRCLWLNPFSGFLPLTYMHIDLMFVCRLLLYESQIQCLCLCKYIDRCAQRYVYNLYSLCIQIFKSNHVAMQSTMHNVPFDEQ